MKKIDLATVHTFEKVCDVSTWEEVQSRIGNEIEEDEWYILDRLMSDYLLCTTMKESMSFLNELEDSLMDNFTREALDYFKSIGDMLELE